MLLGYRGIAHIVLGPVSVVHAELRGTLVQIRLNRSLFEEVPLGEIRFRFRHGRFRPRRFSPLRFRRIASVEDCRGQIWLAIVLCLSLPL
jgi:hypothetical protein